MIVTQPLPPIHPDDKLYTVTLRPQSTVYPWDQLYINSWDSVGPDVVLPFPKISSGGVLTHDGKVDGKEYQLYLSRKGMTEFGMVLFYFRHARPIFREVDGRQVRCMGWHVLMVDVAQHEKVH